jgi:hypothetical protein
VKPAGGGSRCFRPVVWKRLWAPFHYALSVSSVKVVRHKNAEFFCGRLWKRFKHIPASSQGDFKEGDQRDRPTRARPIERIIDRVLVRRSNYQGTTPPV